jgi:hypothetical protein
MVLGVGFAGAIFTTVQAQSAASGAPAALFAGVDAGWLAAAGVGIAGVLASVVRGNGEVQMEQVATAK